VKRYEGLFILNIAGREDGVNEIVDKVKAELASAGARIETIQKMDKRSFTRVASKKHNSGFYANFIFEMAPGGVAALHNRFAMNEDVFRVLFTEAPTIAPAIAPAPAK
jgi:small subunit ribosomal protein S6